MHFSSRAGLVARVAAIVIVVGFGSSIGRAQELTQGFVSGTFSVNKQVRWNGSVLPSGDYEYYVESNTSPQTVRVKQKGGGFSGTFAPETFLRRSGEREGGVVLATMGGELYVNSIYIPSLGGELVFAAPDDPAPADDNTSSADVRTDSKQTLEFVTILNPDHAKIPTALVERLYLKACDNVEQELRLATPPRPRLTLRLGSPGYALRLGSREILLKKWDEYRFASAVVDMVLFDVVPREERDRLSNLAISSAMGTVNVCELKACKN